MDKFLQKFKTKKQQRNETCHTTLHELTPTQNSPTRSLDYHHHKYEEGSWGWKNGWKPLSGEAGGLSRVWDHGQQIHTSQEKAGIIVTLTPTEPFVAFQEYVLGMLHSWQKKKKKLKSERHESVPGLVWSGFFVANVTIWFPILSLSDVSEQKWCKAFVRYTWCWWCHMSSLYINDDPGPLGLTGTGSGTRRSPYTPPAPPPLA